MSKIAYIYFGALIMVFTGCTIISKKEHSFDEYTKDLNRVTHLFPKTISEIEEIKVNAIKNAEQDVNAIIAVPADQRTYANTFGKYDQARIHFDIAQRRIRIIGFVSPDSALRNFSDKISIELSNFAVDFFTYHLGVYAVLQEYAQNNAKKEQLSDSQKYFINETLRAFQRAGSKLSVEKRLQVATLVKELIVLEQEFEKNIADDTSFIAVNRDELAGMDEDFIETLEKTQEGKYKLGIDYPTYSMIIMFCTISSTRKQLYEKYVNQAYPQNKYILEQALAKRDELAHLLGYQSYAYLKLSEEMVKTPERAQEFIDSLLPKAQEKEGQEFVELIKDLPPSVTLTQDGKMQPWDVNFSSEYYKRKKYNYDERIVSEYFPLETTIKGLFNIYESFFDLDMEYQPIKDLWYEDVSLIKIYRKQDRQLLGYIFLDLYPRPNKFSSACEITVVPATKNNDGTINPAVAVVLANFPKSTPNKPSLLKLDDVVTFFHEFGHAIHTILGATTVASFSGTKVKQDFVEMPSQMLEYWLSDRAILKMVGKHYQTGEPLPDTIIDAIITLKNFNSGAYVTRQLFYAQLSLTLFGPGVHKDIDALLRQIWEKSLLFTKFDTDNHMYASFGHLMDYGPRVYSYMWSRVFAADLFYHIKKYGLLNPEIGIIYTQKVLAPGGSIDPNELLRNFLGREPNQKAFLKDMGLK